MLLRQFLGGDRFGSGLLSGFRSNVQMPLRHQQDLHFQKGVEHGIGVSGQGLTMARLSQTDTGDQPSPLKYRLNQISGHIPKQRFMIQQLPKFPGSRPGPSAQAKSRQQILLGDPNSLQRGRYPPFGGKQVRTAKQQFTG